MEQSESSRCSSDSEVGFEILALGGAEHALINVKHLSANLNI
jgi:hypothetical protein